LKQVLFDSDVLLDILMERQPFVVASAKALAWATIPGNEGMVAGHAVTNMFYILRRKVGRDEAIRLISAILQILTVASVTAAVIDAALKSAMLDFEDAVTSIAAEASGAEVIVTRNGSDFLRSRVPTLSPDEFLGEVTQETAP
jgi:predicted nucleic acid-binding protein